MIMEDFDDDEVKIGDPDIKDCNKEILVTNFEGQVAREDEGQLLTKIDSSPRKRNTI